MRLELKIYAEVEEWEASRNKGQNSTSSMSRRVEVLHQTQVYIYIRFYIYICVIIEIINQVGGCADQRVLRRGPDRLQLAYQPLPQA